MDAVDSTVLVDDDGGGQAPNVVGGGHGASHHDRVRNSHAVGGTCRVSFVAVGTQPKNGNIRVFRCKSRESGDLRDLKGRRAWVGLRLRSDQ